MSSVMPVMRLASAAIRHSFEKRLAIARADGPVGALRHPGPARWLAGYSDTVASKWLAFRTSAENILLSRADIALAAASGRDAFDSLDGWLQKTGMA